MAMQIVVTKSEDQSQTILDKSVVQVVHEKFSLGEQSNPSLPKYDNQIMSFPLPYGFAILFHRIGEAIIRNVYE